MAELFTGRPVDPPWIESQMLRSNHLASKADDLFRAIIGGNFGIGTNFYWAVGGHDESFTRYGMEDTEFSYRAYTRGGLIVPAGDTFTWHQSRWNEDRDAKNMNLRMMRGKAAHLIAHPAFRGNSPGRIFMVPQYVVTLDSGYRSSPPPPTRLPGPSWTSWQTTRTTW